MNLKVILYNILVSVLFFQIHITYAQTPETKKDTIVKSTIKKKYNFWKNLYHGNIDRTHEKKFDVSYMAAPSYSYESSFGIGGLASGLYRLDRKDSTMPPSNVSIVGNASLRGLYAVGLNGNNYFVDKHSRLSYEMLFTSKPLNFWGITYDACAVNPVIKYTRQQVKVNAEYTYKIIKNFYVGANVNFLYAKIHKINNNAYLEKQKLSYTTTGIGFSLQYDSRDFIPNATKGIYLIFRETIFPKRLGNYEQQIFRSTFIADYYQKLWKGGLVAFDLYGQCSNTNLPWSLREELGGGFRMRGYYTGRYMDNNIISCQMELRQHIFERFGAVAWVGAGNIFSAFNQFNWKHTLLTYGIGLRWEFKHRVNIRIDYGFGKGSNCFVFGLNESF